MLKRVAPEVSSCSAGPKSSHESKQQQIVQLADYVVTGWGDVSFPAAVPPDPARPAPLMKIHAGVQPPLADIALPYACTPTRTSRSALLYVEASRGCPFKCEFCLSSLDKTAWPFELERFLAELESCTRAARGSSGSSTAPST